MANELVQYFADENVCARFEETRSTSATHRAHIHINTVFQNHSKRVPGTRIGAHVMIPGLGLTMMVTEYIAQLF